MKCPFCAEEIHNGSVKCVHCHSDLQGGGGGAAGAATLNANPIGVERNVIVVFLLSLVTCGIYGIIHFFQVAGDINRHYGFEKLKPGLDLLLIIVTCGIWYIVMCYQYGRAFYELELSEGLSPSDNSTLYIILAIFGLSFVPFLIIQNDLNEHWKKHVGGGV